MAVSAYDQTSVLRYDANSAIPLNTKGARTTEADAGANRHLFERPSNITESNRVGTKEIKLSHDQGRQAAPHLKDAQKQKFVDAAVVTERDGQIFLSCFGASGEFSVHLPQSFIPANLRSVGQPVRISLQTKEGVRFPLVEARALEKQEATPDPELDAWIESL